MKVTEKKILIFQSRINYSTQESKLIITRKKLMPKSFVFVLKYIYGNPDFTLKKKGKNYLLGTTLRQNKKK